MLMYQLKWYTIDPMSVMFPLLKKCVLLACPSTRVAEKKLEELPKNVGVLFLIYWRGTYLDTVGNVLRCYENQITLDDQN